MGISQASNELKRVRDGARDDANKVMIVVTDGRSTEPDRTSNAARQAHQYVIRCFELRNG